VTASYLIGLREGLEATLVVSILVAFLVKSDQRRYLPHVWAGVAAAAAPLGRLLCVLTFTSTTLSFTHQELFEAIASALAVVFVTWMIFWMRRMARRIAGELRAQLSAAIQLAAAAVVFMAFVAVVREGLETALLFFSAVQGATASAGPLLAILGGIATAIAIGWLMYAGAVRFNLGRFFFWTGILLVLVAAGILKYSVHDFQEAGVLPGLSTGRVRHQRRAAPDAWYAALLGRHVQHHARADRARDRRVARPTPSPSGAFLCRTAASRARHPDPGAVAPDAARRPPEKPEGDTCARPASLRSARPRPLRRRPRRLR
jgi:high-affinity iron transporter